MKKVFALSIGIAAMAIMSVPAYSQQQQTSTETSMTPKLGVKAGLNLSNLYVDDVDDENMKAGLNVGLVAKLPVTQGFSIQPELLYSSKGAKLKYDNVFGEGEYRFNLNYIELPVLAVVNIGPNFNVHAGPYVSYLVSANIKNMDDQGNVDDVADLNVDDFNRFDYGVAGGIGVDLDNFMIGARYNYGLGEIGDDGNISGQALHNSKNSVISVYIGIGF